MDRHDYLRLRRDAVLGVVSELKLAADVQSMTAAQRETAATALETVWQVQDQEPIPPRSDQPKVPRDLQTICLKALNKDIKKRYATAADMAEDLRRFERGEPIKARPMGPVERAVRWVRRRPALAGALAAGVLLGWALLVIILWWHGQRKALEAEESPEIRLGGTQHGAAALQAPEIGDFGDPAPRGRGERRLCGRCGPLYLLFFRRPK
jgi:hypothetical protein